MSHCLLNIGRIRAGVTDGRSSTFGQGSDDEDRQPQMLVQWFAAGLLLVFTSSPAAETTLV